MTGTVKTFEGHNISLDPNTTRHDLLLSLSISHNCVTVITVASKAIRAIQPQSILTRSNAESKGREDLTVYIVCLILTNDKSIR